MDKLNQKILVELLQNSRIPIMQLAKKVRSSREVVSYRIETMKKEGIILQFITELNIPLLGFKSAAVFMNIKSKKEKEFIEYIKKCDFTAWSGQFCGVWRFGVDIYGKESSEIDEKFREIYRLFEEDILSHRLTMYKSKHFMYEKYFSLHTKELEIKKHQQLKLDSINLRILMELSKDSRIDSVSLSKIVNLSAPAVTNRIRALENAGYILKYSIFIDVSKIGLYQYSVLITNNNMNEREKLISYLKKHIKVSFIAEYIGDPFLEFGVVVKDPYDLREIIAEIEESFPDNRIFELFLIQKEVLSIGPPKCIFNPEYSCLDKL